MRRLVGVLSGGMQNGYYNTGDGRIYVNTQSGDPAVQVISHELTHSIEKSRFYAKLQQVVLKKIKADGLDLDTLRAEKQVLYERHGVADVDTDSEIVAEYVAKNLLTDEQSIRSLVLESQTLGQRIMEFIDQLLAMLGNKNAQERELLSKARRYYQKALADSWGQEATMRQGWFNKVHRILSPEGTAFTLPKMANAEMNTVGAFTNGSQSLRGSTPAINSAFKNSIPENTEFGKREL